ncbi:hypothetical protein QFC19_002177 [Naganishia cerealis]|uniref:Uncharacterized protein n=1 Tax=Naganishia cerealis TaxID=610337 RepID=A0ACC2WE58_9TREE|nr:hypothetical protein QFC19_002177 [Naganishia cerealis]
MEKQYSEPYVVQRPRKKLWAHAVGAGCLLMMYFYGNWSFDYFNFGLTTANDSFDYKRTFLNALTTNLAGNWSEKYTSEPHLAGTNYGFVDWTKDKFEEYGLKATVDTYDIYVSYPHEHSLKLLRAKDDKLLYEAPLKEDEIKKDKTSVGGKDAGVIPTFLGYAANGNVTAEYVYVNYGTKQDFETLEKLGVSVAGKIAVARYGSIFRGLKVKFAQDAGAVGVLLYTDPGDDAGITPANGYKQYPEGPARHESSVQRGSVQFLGAPGATPGDPTTPGYASVPGAERKDPHNSIGKIPVLPISYREVTPILKLLNGHGEKAPKEWKGELEGFDYYTGPNKNVTLNLYNDQVFKVQPLHNVYGEIEGEKKDEVIIIGNHRDAWIKGGAGDPNSGSAVLIELARAFGQLKAAGFKFKRTIVLQSYDGEEYGLLGSTEYGENYAHDLTRKVVSYINLDSAVTGKNLHLGASPVLNQVLRSVAKELDYPEKKVGSLYDHFVDVSGDKIHTLGSGSDYTVFLEHLGIPSVDLGFGAGKGDAVYQYHSNYDSYYWMTHFGDPGFVYHNLAAKYVGLLALQLSEHEIIDFGTNDYANALVDYFSVTEKLIPKKWLKEEVSKGEGWNEFLRWDMADLGASKELAIAYSPRNLYPFPELFGAKQCKHNRLHQMIDLAHHKELKLEDIVKLTKTDLERLQNATQILDSESHEIQVKFDNRDALNFWQRIKLHFQIKHHNALLQYFERNFLHHKGLHERSWFKHIVFASGRYTGYAGQDLPGLREALEDEDFDRFVHWLGIFSKALRRVSAHVG